MANCETCKSKNAPETVPYIMHELAMARMDRQIKRLWISVIVAVCLLFAISAIFTYAWLQYEAITDDGGDANIIGNDGDIYNGYSEIEETNP